MVITGSSGKTTLLHLIESQIGSLAKYSHKANSSFGIPFDILGLHRIKETLDEWPLLIIKAPFMLFTRLPKKKLYIVEADCDRPHEGDFLSRLLNPEVTLWLNVSRTHSMNFDKLVGHGFKSVEETIAFEFGYFGQRTKKLVIANVDSQFLADQLERVSAPIVGISAMHSLKNYQVSLGITEYLLDNQNYTFKYLLPREIATSILMCRELLKYLNLKFDDKFTDFKLPPGRNSLFKGIKGITIVDSTYNANFDSMQAVINMFREINDPNKWVVLGDMLEQGRQEEEEHKKLAELIFKNNFKRIILMGPRVSEYTYPELKRLGTDVPIKHYLNPKEVLEDLTQNIKGGEIILFKGARFLEGVIANLLLDESQAKDLARREKVWEIRRKKWGL